MFEEYLKKIGLNNLISHTESIELNNFVAEIFSTKFPDLSEKEIEKLYAYDVPKMSADGSCSILEEKAEDPYNLAKIFELELDFKKLKNHTQTIRLWRLNKITEKIYKSSEVEWFGIYRKTKNPAGDLVLVKEAYRGVFSRAEFPLTKEFAKKSNNSTVGISGKAIIIQDVNAHKGAYYECDNKVNSEFCLPILDRKNKIIGIIDAEAFAKNHYTSARLLQIAKIAFDLGGKNLGI